MRLEREGQEKEMWKSACPRVFFPQQCRAPAAVRPQLWRPPAAMAVKVRPAGGIVRPSLSRPQQWAEPAVSRAQAC